MERLAGVLPETAQNGKGGPAETVKPGTGADTERETGSERETESPERRRERLARETARTERYNQAEGGLQRFDGVDCPVCRNRGYFYRLTEEGDMVAVRCGCMTERETLRRFRQSGLGSVIREYTFDRFLTPEPWQRQMKETAQAFCRDAAAKWLYIGGQVGCGKTHLCTAVCADYIRRGYDVRYMLWAEKARQLKALVNDYRAYAEMMKEYKNIPVLYIDDFLKVRQGAEPSDGDLNLAFELINARLLQPEKITVISSEKTLFDAMEYDEAVMSRIFRQCGKYHIDIARDRDKNYRLRGTGAERGELRAESGERRAES